MTRARLSIVLLAAIAAVALALAGDASACVCVDVPVDERLDQADAAVVGRIVELGAPDPTSPEPTRLMTVEVEQRVKGEVRGQVRGVDKTWIVVQVPNGTDCDVTIDTDTTTGLLLTRLPEGTWFASACSVVEPGRLVAAGGEPRGGAIKVVLGVIILAIVLSWALRRRARGVRPRLPGAPEP
ncbi:MAG: hypothetical protein ACRDNY_03805 [Gaiellaceae bacterium]